SLRARRLHAKSTARRAPASDHGSRHRVCQACNMIQKPTSTSITGKRAAPGRALAVSWTSYFGMADTSGRRSASSRSPEPVGQCEPLGLTARLKKILQLKGGRSFQPAAFLFSMLRECVAANDGQFSTLG